VKKIDKNYKYRQLKERIAQYDFNDIVNCDTVELFKTDKHWEGARKNYDSYLSKGKFAKGKIKPEYRRRLRQSIMLKVTKMYFRMIMEDILAGHKIKIGFKYVRFFIGNRRFDSWKYKSENKNGEIDYIPYIYLSKNITRNEEWRMSYLRFSDKYEKIFRRHLRKGRKYKLNNG
jgi:hypothetical protein